MSIKDTEIREGARTFLASITSTNMQMSLLVRALEENKPSNPEWGDERGYRYKVREKIMTFINNESSLNIFPFKSKKLFSCIFQL